ncbi:unnamed protein product, partial [Coregonus sp. 'balchen']
MKSMERELHCPVCKEIVKQPVVLPCQHSVCLMCASEVLDLGCISRRGDGVRNRPLRCCFHAHPVGGRYRHTVSLGSVAVMCQFCKPPQSLEATKGCADCRASFCNECFKLYHPWGTPRAQHEHVQPTLNFRPKVLSCPEHDQERLHFYCRTCQRLLCPLCKLRRVHAGHKVAPVAQAYQTLKDKITKEMNYILANQETANSVAAREQLSQSVRDLTALLAERHASLAQALEGARQKRGEALAGQVAERRSLLEHAGLMALSQELLKETDPPCFVQAARQTHSRLSTSIEGLQCFSLAADPSFRHFQLDVSKELKLLTDLQFIQAPLAPVIDTQKTLAYDKLFLCWRLPQESAAAWHFSVEFRRRGVVPGGGARGGIQGRLAAARWGWQRLEEVGGTSAVIDRLEMDMLNFYLDSRWGLHADRLVVSKEQRCARSVPGLSLLQATDLALTSCHLTADLLVGDVAITQGRHYWACSTWPVPDSGHDSGAEDSLDSPPPFSFLTMGMGKIFLPHAPNHHNNHGCPANGTSPRRSPTIANGNSPASSPTGLTYPLPPRLGVCLDFEKGRVTFYDAHSLRPLWEGPVDCSGPVCPAFCFIGGGALQLQELVANRMADQTP